MLNLFDVHAFYLDFSNDFQENLWHIKILLSIFLSYQTGTIYLTSLPDDKLQESLMS